MHDVRNASVPTNIYNLFTNTTKIYSYNNRFLTPDNIYVNRSRLEVQKNDFSRVGTKLWNEISASL